MRPAPRPDAPNAPQLPDGWDWPALAIVRRTLPNGLRVILAENHAVPLVFLSWASQAGFESDPADQEGIASLTPLLLREGTALRTGRRIAEELDDMGAELAAGADWDSAFANIGLLSCDLAAGLELLLDMARGARFPPEAVARLRQRRLAELALRRREPRALASDEFARALFGVTLYGHSSLGTPPSIQRIDAVALAAFHEARYRPETSCLVIAGNFDGDTAMDLLGSFDLRPALRAIPPVPPPSVAAFDAPGGVRLVDVPHAPKTEIRVGHAGVARDSEHLPALEVLNAILGGGPTSRLARSLRQHAGLTYHVRSRFDARRLGGAFVVETSVAHDATGAALAAIHREIQKLCDERVPAADLEQTRRSLFGVELRRFQDLIGTGAALGPIALQNDPVLHLERRRQAIATTEPDALRELARRYLHPERLIAVVAGPADALRGERPGDGGDWCRPFPLELTS